MPRAGLAVPAWRTMAAVIGAGFRRYATYRQAMVAGAVTNTVFGFLRCYVLLSIATASGHGLAGYDATQLATYVWAGQGMLAVVDTWSQLDLAERVRTGDVVADLLRPIDPLWTYLGTELGRASFAMLTRFVAPVAVGLFAFHLYLPHRGVTYPLAALSILGSMLIGFVCRYLIGLSAFWLLDTRGVNTLWVFFSGACSGLYFPLAVLPGPLSTLLWVATPFPSLLQAPLDILVERGGTGHALLILAGQLFWLTLLVLCCRAVQRRALDRLVVQGG